MQNIGDVDNLPDQVFLDRQKGRFMADQIVDGPDNAPTFFAEIAQILEEVIGFGPRCGGAGHPNKQEVRPVQVKDQRTRMGRFLDQLYRCGHRGGEDLVISGEFLIEEMLISV